MCVCVSHGYKRKIFWRVRVQESEITAEFKIENLHRLSIMQVRLLVSKDLTARVNSLFNQRFDIRLKWLEYLKHLFIGEFFFKIRFESCVCALSMRFSISTIGHISSVWLCWWRNVDRFFMRIYRVEFEA